MLRQILSVLSRAGSVLASGPGGNSEQPNSILVKRWHKPEGGCPCAGHDEADSMTVHVSESFKINGECLKGTSINDVFGARLIAVSS